MKHSMRLGDILVSNGVITREQAESAEAASVVSGSRIGDILLEKKLCTQGDIYHALYKQGKRVIIDRAKELPEWSYILNDVGGILGNGVRCESVVAISEVQNGAIFIVANEDAGMQLMALSSLAQQNKISVRGIILTKNPSLIDLIYSQNERQYRGAQKKSDKDSTEFIDYHDYFDKMVIDAFKAGASDIHITVYRDSAEVKFRIHGELELRVDLAPDYATEMCRSIYNSLSETGSTKDGFNPRLTQDAVIERDFDVGSIRVRYSGLPIAPDGFDVTLRLIPIGVTAKRKSFADLGYSKDQCEDMIRMFSRSSGLICFAGTTGSGKSTTLAQALMQVAEDRPGKKIRTVEEPVEYRIEGAHQTPVTRVHGDSRDFLIVLRQIMRADPDVIMVGEIRDDDTAKLAIQAVRSGHLCVSTIHADGSPVCYDRLTGMGVARDDMATVGLVVAFVYQKLVPVLCNHCKIPAENIAEHINDGGNVKYKPIFNRLEKKYGKLNGFFFRRENGCPRCNNRGITGRTVCAEILPPTPKMLRAIKENDSNSLWTHWRSTIDKSDPSIMRGKTAFEHALWKMEQGIVAPDGVESEFRYIDETPYGDD